MALYDPVWPEAAAGAIAVRQVVGHGRPVDGGNRRHHELGDAHAGRHGKGSFPVVDEDDFYLASIVAVYRAGRVEHRDAVTAGETRSRADLPPSNPAGMAMAKPHGTT